MVSRFSHALCILLSMATLAQSGHICNNGIHYYVEHSMKCRRQNQALPGSNKEQIQRYNEMLGCNLFDFTNGKRFNRYPDQQVHWPGGVADLEHFQYTQHDNVSGHSTCLTLSNCGPGGTKKVKYCADDNCSQTEEEEEKCYGTTHEEFRMPDYCSRAIMSELSTVYNGVQRTTAISAGARVLLASADKKCFMYRTLQNKDSVIKDILGQDHSTKACWNHANDWRRLYCVKYHQCSCPRGTSPEDCSKNADLVNCCKSQYQEFLDSEYNIYEGYPLRKKCQGPLRSRYKRYCEKNPMTSPQKDFDQSEVQDLSKIY